MRKRIFINLITIAILLVLLLEPANMAKAQDSTVVKIGDLLFEVTTLPVHNVKDATAGDLDGDGDKDLFLARAGIVGGDLPDRVWFNDGKGNFFDGNQLLGKASSYGVDLGDLDGDGDLDACTVTRNELEFNQVWLNDGNGNFTSGQQLDQAHSTDVTFGDFNGDGHPDLFATSWYSGCQIYLNDGNGNLSLNQVVGDLADNNTIYGPHEGISSPVDLDEDGDLDVVVAVADKDEPNRVFLNNGDGTFDNNGQRLGNSSSNDVALGDIDGDGDSDAVFANSNGYANELWLNDGKGNFTQEQIFGYSSNLVQGCHSVVLVDLDEDSDLDAVIPDWFIGTDPRIPNRGRNIFWENVSLLKTKEGPFVDTGTFGVVGSRAAVTGDFDGNGLLDVIIFADITGDSQIWLQHSFIYLPIILKNH